MDAARNWLFNVSIPLLRFVGVFLFASIFLFLAIRAMPGDPVSLRMKNPDPERVAEIRNQLGLNDALPVQYLAMIRDFVVGDWGSSLVSGRSVSETVARYLPATIELGVLAIFFGTCLGLSLALIGHASDRPVFLQAGRGLGALGLTVPIFWIGLFFILIFAVKLGWLPSGGRFDYVRVAPRGTGFLLLDSIWARDWESFSLSVRYLILPVLTLSLYPAAVVAGTAEARLGEPRISQLVRSLKARGMHPVRIWIRHILRYLAVPVVTVLGTQAGALLGGAILTETVFSWPGMGRFLLDGVLNRDLYVIQNGLLLVILLALSVVTLSDLIARLGYPERARGGIG